MIKFLVRIYDKSKSVKHIFLVMYVDDILLASNNIKFLYETKDFLTKQFEDIRKASFVIGI